jgi:hypothetical protein
MRRPRTPSPARLKRLLEELVEEGFGFAADWPELLQVEVDYALRPEAHERRVPSFGSIVEPSVGPAHWDGATELHTTVRCVDGLDLADARRFADGLSSWLVRAEGWSTELAVFDRPAGSERDLVVLAAATGATLVQRHPVGAVRIVGGFGVLRWDNVSWHHEPPTGAWVDGISHLDLHGDAHVRTLLAEFAVHDLGARGIGAILVYRPDGPDGDGLEQRLAEPPPLDIRRPADLAPLRHVLAQIDGAAVFDGDGVLRQLGVRLVPSAEAESDVEGFRGMRHTSGRRYSHDDPTATVIVISEDGPVTVLRNGELAGRSEAVAASPDEDSATVS